jgi:hypothetical protein
MIQFIGVLSKVFSIYNKINFMLNKNFIKIINEEINKFDFLGNEEFSKEQEITDLLQNEDFQKQFICDSLVQNNKIKKSVIDARIGGNWEEDDFEDANKLTIEYFLKIEYKYDQAKEPIKFDLSFYSDGISVSKTGWYDKGRFGGTPDTDIEPSGEAWFNGFNWNDISVDLNTGDGDEIDFLAFKHAPPKIQVLFIREYTQDYIGTYTSMDIKTPEMRDKVQNVPYC